MKRKEYAYPNETCESAEEADFLFNLQRECGMPVYKEQNSDGSVRVSIMPSLIDTPLQTPFTKGDIVYSVYDETPYEIEDFEYKYNYLFDGTPAGKEPTDVILCNLTNAETITESVHDMHKYTHDLDECRKYKRNKIMSEVGRHCLLTILAIGLIFGCCYGIARLLDKVDWSQFKQSDVQPTKEGDFNAVVRHLEIQQGIDTDGNAYTHYVVTLDSNGKGKDFFLTKNLYDSLKEGSEVTVHYVTTIYTKDEYAEKRPVKKGALFYVGDLSNETDYTINGVQVVPAE